VLCAHKEHVWVEDLAVQEGMQERLAGSMFLKMVVLSLQLFLYDIHVGRNNRDTGSVLIFSSATWGNTTKIVLASKDSLISWQEVIFSSKFKRLLKKLSY